MRIGLTGEDGFTGHYVRVALEARDIEVVPLDANLLDAAQVDAEIAAKPFDRLIHLAAKAFTDSSDWRAFYEVNTIGSFNLLDAVARHRPGSRCVLASSAQIYGPQASGILAEDALPAPATPYAVSKYAMELGARRWGGDLSIVFVRPFNYTGVGQGEQYLIPKIVGHFRRRAPVIELGNLNVVRDFGDVRSAAEAYAGLVLGDDTGGAVNICSGTVYGLRDVIDLATAATGHRIEVRVNPAFVRKDEVAVLGGSNARLRRLVPGWQPRQLSETLDWMLGDVGAVVRATRF